MSFGEKLKAQRKKMDKTQKEVADRIAMNQSNYSKLERDLQQPNLEQLRKICDYLDISSDVLLETKYAYATDKRLISELSEVIQKYNDGSLDFKTEQ